ncbi:hypothetical protein SAMN04488026_10183 [Aliiruegeria lutimaris]|uniref:Uncharacterized protein n=2 Tax=Aliiruegeria lutimaris TaxID=571298 RepID=A0A1G8TYV2_9RHOB|nr:hypothetical protein SAMN04488026_10183 [Aliiruegeria lutimaris]
MYRPALDSLLLSLLLVVGSVNSIKAQEMAPTLPSVDQLNFTVSGLSGDLGGYSNSMVAGSVAFPVNAWYGVQLDGAVGSYREDYMSFGTAFHFFHRNPERGAVGFYLDYGYVNPEHNGQFGVEGALYLDNVTLEALVGVRGGTNVYVEAFDEIDITYYFNENIKASVGHRYSARGNVGNVGFEIAPSSLNGWSVFGEAEAGEDDNQSAYLGIRYAFGSQRYSSLMERDREGQMRVRLPRVINNVTRCGPLPETQDANLGRHEMNILCASASDLEDEGATEEKK